LLSLLRYPLITRLVVEQQDRLTRFGFLYIETLLEFQGRTIEVVNPADYNREDLLHDKAAHRLLDLRTAVQAATSKTEGSTPR